MKKSKADLIDKYSTQL